MAKVGWFFRLIDVSLETANRFYAFGWGASLSGAAITLVGVVFLMWGTRVRDHDFESQMSSLNSEAGAARERAAKLELTLEQVRRQAGVRVFDPAVFSAQLKKFGKPAKVEIIYSPAAGDGWFVSWQLRQLLGAAGWGWSTSPITGPADINDPIFSKQLPSVDRINRTGAGIVLLESQADMNNLKGPGESLHQAIGQSLGMIGMAASLDETLTEGNFRIVIFPKP